MAGSRFSASVPRRQYWSDEVGGHSFCPECGRRLVTDRHAYVLLIRRQDQDEFHLTNLFSGYFCADCPVVVLDREDFVSIARALTLVEPAEAWAALGFADLDAVPRDKRNEPFGDDNPLPLIEFLDCPPPPASPPEPSPDQRPPRATRARGDRKKRRRGGRNKGRRKRR